MSDPIKREWRLYVADMTTFANNVIEYTRGMDLSALVADRRTFDATLRNLELIGEAASRIPDSVRASNPDIPWRLIIATRNRLIHGYLGIDNDTLWNLVEVNVPELVSKLEKFRDAG